MTKATHLRLLATTVGFFSAGIGVGGGAILVPGLMHVGRYDFRRASSLSLATIAPISLVGAITHLALLDGVFPFAQLAVFVAAGTVGVLIGAALVGRVPTRGLKLAFGLFLVAVSLKLLTGWQVAAFPLHAAGEMLSAWPVLSLAVFGVLVGVTSSLMGVGCGLVIVPFCLCVLGFGIHLAIPFSLVTMLFLSSAGAAGRYRHNLLDVGAARRLIPWATVGAVAGAAVSSQLPDAALRTAFGALLLLVGVKYVGEEAMRVPKLGWQEVDHGPSGD